MHLEPSLESIRVESNVLAVEALRIHMPNRQMLTRLANLTKDFSSYVGGTIRGLLTKQDQVDLVRNISAMSNVVAKADYVELSQVLVPTPEGLQVTFLEYTDALLDAQKIALGIYDNYLYPFSLMLGEIINDPERAQNLTQGSRVKFQSLDSIQKRMGKMFSGVKSEKPYGQCVKRNSDWKELDRKIAELNVNQTKLPIAMVMKSVSEVEEKLRKVVDGMQDTSQKYRPTSKLIEDLAQLTHALAEQVTFYSFVTTSTQVFLKAVEDGQKIIESAAK